MALSEGLFPGRSLSDAHPDERKAAASSVRITRKHRLDPMADNLG